MKKRKEKTTVKIVNSSTKKVLATADIDNDTGEILDGEVNQAYPENNSEATLLKGRVYNFELIELRMKKARWEMHTLISGTMNQIHKNYRLTLVVNLDRIEEKLELCRGRMEKAQMRVDGGSDAHDEYTALLFAKDELIKNCPDIVLDASVIQSKYPVGDTFIVFHISPEVINQLNDRRNYIEHYDLKMEPLIVPYANE